MTKRAEILETAKTLICADREQQYGAPEKNFAVIASLWTAYLHKTIGYFGFNLDAEDVALMMALLKVGRIITGGHSDDNFVDMTGYVALAGEISFEKGANS